MSADRLREAARVLRDRATEAIESSDWAGEGTPALANAWGWMDALFARS